MNIGPSGLLDVYTKMITIRQAELRVGQLFAEGRLPGFVHLYMGQEAVATAVIAQLRNTDYITSTHRSHGHVIARGGNLNRIFAEIYGKATGYCRGKGGSMHIADIEIGFLGGNGIVGAGLPIAAGAAFRCKHLGTGNVVACFFGDGATNQGTFHEALNLAALWSLPVVFICENNLYAEGTRQDRHQKIENIADRAIAYGMPGAVVDGNDVMAVYEAARVTIERARKGGGPTLLECKTYREHGHFEGDPELYRTKDEVEFWNQKDPIPLYERYLKERGVLTPALQIELFRQVQQEVEDAVRFAEESQYPAAEELLTDVYSPSNKGHYSGGEQQTPARQLNFAQAVNEALRQEMRRDPNIFLAGEDIGVWADPYNTTSATAGLLQEFGEGRVKDTPISESAILGLAVGSAATGLRPVVEIMFVDFLGVCLDQLFNQAAKMRYMFGGQVKLPMTVRVKFGIRKGGGAHHSQSLEAWLAHVPGLKVVMPSGPYDAKGLLVSAIRDDNPVVFLEHKKVNALQADVPEELYSIPLGVADIKRQGNDVTIVATAYMVHEALAAADRLAADGIGAEVIDPRTLVPLDMETIVTSVKKTRHLVVVHEAVKFCGFGAEIAASVMEEAFDCLDAPIARVGAPFTPVPLSPPLEEAYLPNQQKIIEAAKRVVAASAKRRG